MGGHIVQGHVDGVAKLIEFEQIPNSDNWWLHIEVTPDLEREGLARDLVRFGIHGSEQLHR